MTQEELELEVEKYAFIFKRNDNNEYKNRR